MTASARTERARVVLAAAIVLLLVSVVLSLGVGARPIAPVAVLDALFAPDPSNPDHIVLLTQRIPRTVIGILAGRRARPRRHGDAGAHAQPARRPRPARASTPAPRSPCSPRSRCSGSRPRSGFIWFAFGGAAVAAVVVALIGSRGPDGGNPAKLALTGAAVTAGLTAVTLLILTTDYVALDVYRYWSVGGLTARGLDSVALVFIPIAVGIGTRAVLRTGPRPHRARRRHRDRTRP